MSYNDLIEGLIETNKLYRKHIQLSDRYAISPLFYTIEFCTIAVDIGRGVGKTTFIKNHAQKDDLVIVANHNLKRIQYGMNTLFMVIIPDEIYKIKGKKFKNIYIDEPKKVFVGDFEKKTDMYNLLIDPYGDQTFILLGSQI